MHFYLLSANIDCKITACQIYKKTFVIHEETVTIHSTFNPSNPE